MTTSLDVVIPGEANIDLLLYGLPETLPLERELLADGMKLVLGGSPAITAHNLAVLGSRVGFVSLSGEDVFARLCMDELRDAGVDLSRVVQREGSAGTGISVLLQHEGTRHMLTYAGSTAMLALHDLDMPYIASARHLHLASYFLQQALRKDVPAVLAHCRGAGMTVSFDPNDDPSGCWPAETLDLLQYVDVLMPNEREACRLAHEEESERAIAKLRDRVPTLVVKQGRRGATAFHNGVRYSSPAISVQSIDAVGAGDSFNAGFLHGFLRGSDIEACLHLGNIAGAYSTTAVGGTQAFRDRKTLGAFMALHGEAAGRTRRI